MPFNLFKDAPTKAQDEFTKAYEKGVNLGPEKWQDAVSHFSNAANHFLEAGNPQKSKESQALAILFTALIKRDATAWQNCSRAMMEIQGTPLNVGFAANSTEVAKEAQVMSEDIAATQLLNGNSKDISRVSAIKGLAQKYLELVGSDLVIWKLMKEEIDPQRRAYYLLGLASLIEANNLIETDPRKSVSLLSEAATHLELAGVDPMNLRAGTVDKRENVSKIAKCWFCGREMQGMGYHYVMLPATVSAYTRQRYAGEAPQSLGGNSVIACESCSSSIRNVADVVAKVYYDRAIAEINSVAQRLDARMDALQREVNSLRSRVNSIPR